MNSSADAKASSKVELHTCDKAPGLPIRRQDPMEAVNDAQEAGMRGHAYLVKNVGESIAGCGLYSFSFFGPT